MIRLAAALSVARSSPRGGRLRVLLGCPTPADPFCSAVIAGLRALLVRLGLDAPMLIDPLADGRLPPAVSDCVDVLHYVCHGDFLHDAFLLQGGERPHLPGVLVGQVADDLGRLPLVVLDVCGAGDPGLAPLTTLVGQMLQGSAQAVVAPARAALVGASQAFSQGLYRALGRGASVVQAVVEGRSQVRTLAHPHPSARAANLLLSVSRLSTLRAAPPLESGWVPEGWPRPDAELRALLGRARLLARNEESGHVGIEHLVRSARAGEGGTLNARLRIVRDRLELNLRSVAVPSVGRADCVATPRLRGLLKGAPEGVGLEDLWRALVSDPDHGLHALARLPLALLILPPPRGMPTPPGLGSPARRPPATALQLIWGPMDGWILRPQPGQTLGRASAAVGPDLPIYPPDHTEEDIALSRRHLAWQGPGRVQILRAVRHVKLGDSEEDAPVVESGILALDVGDLLILTQHTWLRGVGP